MDEDKKRNRLEPPNFWKHAATWSGIFGALETMGDPETWKSLARNGPIIGSISLAFTTESDTIRAVKYEPYISSVENLGFVLKHSLKTNRRGLVASADIVELPGIPPSVDIIKSTLNPTPYLLGYVNYGTGQGYEIMVETKYTRAMDASKESMRKMIPDQPLGEIQEPVTTSQTVYDIQRYMYKFGLGGEQSVNPAKMVVVFNSPNDKELFVEAGIGGLLDLIQLGIDLKRDTKVIDIDEVTVKLDLRDIPPRYVLDNDRAMNIFEKVFGDFKQIGFESERYPDENYVASR